MIQEAFRWQGNDAAILVRLYDSAPYGDASDVIELIIHPSEEQETGWAMNREDALALIAMLSRVVFLMEVGPESVKDSLDREKDNDNAI